MTLRTLNYGNYGIFLIMGNAGFCPSAVVLPVVLGYLGKSWCRRQSELVRDWISWACCRVERSGYMSRSKGTPRKDGGVILIRSLH